MVRQALVVALLLPLWPFVGLYMVCRRLVERAFCEPKATEEDDIDAALPPSLMQRVRLSKAVS